MSEAALRAAVRDAIARHLAKDAGAGARPPAGPVGPSGHAAFMLCVVPGGSDAGGACLVEPSVACTHCGFCQSTGY